MSHPSHKIAGPLLRNKDLKTGKPRTIATPEQMRAALTYPYAWVPTIVADEWVNEAARKNGLSGTSEIAGKIFRTNQGLRRAPKSSKPTWAQERKRHSWLQRIARRITRLFNKR